MGTLYSVNATTGSITTAGTVTSSGVPVLPSHSFLASGGTITPDATITSSVNVSVDAAATIDGPTGGYDLQKMTFRLTQDVSGHTVTFSTGAGNFRFGTDIPSFTASGPSLSDYVGVIYNAADTVWDIVSVIQGF